MLRLALTGASGFLGSALARHFCKIGCEVHVLVRPLADLARLGEARRDVVVHAIADAGAAGNVVAAVRPDAIVHTACSYGRAGESPGQMFDANVLLGVRLLEAVLQGDHRTTVLNTGSALDPSVNLYALSKRQFSAWGERLAESHPEQLRFIDLRLQHMYGPADDPSKFTTHVIHACRDGQTALRLTAGEQQRDLIHVDDVVAAYDTVLTRADELPTHETIDVGTGVAPTIREFVERVRRITGASTRLEFGALPYRPNESMHCVADTSRLRSFGWTPTHDLTSGIEDVLRKELAP